MNRTNHFSYNKSLNNLSFFQGDDLVIANLGDSRAVLGTITETGLTAVQLTTDLKPGLSSKIFD